VRLARYVRKRGESPLAVDDVVQEVAARVLSNEHVTFVDADDLLRWCQHVARNAIVDGLRRSPPPTVDDPPDLPSSDAGPEEVAEAEWTAWRVHRALETLSTEERSLVELAYWSGMSQSEIAEYVDLPLGTVKTRTRSALRRLADELEDELR